jgi:hypothetical protein
VDDAMRPLFEPVNAEDWAGDRDRVPQARAS